MKIALLVPGGVDRSGEHRVIPALLALIKRLALQHEVHVYALRQEPLPGHWRLHGANVHNIGGVGIASEFRALAAILREGRARPFDVVHAIWSGAGGGIAVAAAKILRVPSVVHIAGGELIALPAIGYGGRLTWRARLRESLVLRGASAVTAASDPVIAQLAALGRKGRRVPLGVDLQTWPARDPVRRDAKLPARLIHIASLNRVKDQATLLRALGLLAAQGIAFHLDVAGEDTLGGSVQTLARQLGLAPHVSFHGFMTQRQLRPLLEQAHINLISSLHEAGPMVVLEAAVVGVPSVGTAVGHLEEWAPEAALAVAVGDTATLAAAMARLIADEDLRLALAAQAKRRALLHDADHTAAMFQALYAELTGR